MVMQTSREDVDGLTHVRVQGSVAPADTASLLSSGDAQLPPLTIIDLRACELALPQNCLMDLALRVSRVTQRMQCVLVAASDLHYATARQLAAFVVAKAPPTSRVQVKVMRDMDAAQAWLAKGASRNERTTAGERPSEFAS